MSLNSRRYLGCQMKSQSFNPTRFPSLVLASGTRLFKELFIRMWSQFSSNKQSAEVPVPQEAPNKLAWLEKYKKNSPMWAILLSCTSLTCNCSKTMRSDLWNTIKSSWAIQTSSSSQVCRCLHFGPIFRVNSKKMPSPKYPLTSSKYQKSARLVRAYKTHSSNRIFTEMVCSLSFQVKWWHLKFMEV